MKPVNLRQARKQRERMKKAEKASENAAKFGRTKGEKEQQVARLDGQRHHLDQHKLDE